MKLGELELCVFVCSASNSSLFGLRVRSEDALDLGDLLGKVLLLVGSGFPLACWGVGFEGKVPGAGADCGRVSR